MTQKKKIVFVLKIEVERSDYHHLCLGKKKLFQFPLLAEEKSGEKCFLRKKTNTT